MYRTPHFVVNIMGADVLPCRITENGLLMLSFIILSHYWCSTSQSRFHKENLPSKCVPHIIFQLCRMVPHRFLIGSTVWSIVRNTFSNGPDSKVHGANIGPIWGRQDPCGPHVASWTLLSGSFLMSGCRLIDVAYPRHYCKGDKNTKYMTKPIIHCNRGFRYIWSWCELNV